MFNKPYSFNSKLDSIQNAMENKSGSHASDIISDAAKAL